MQDPPVTPREEYDDALRSLALALERLAEAFQILERMLLVNGVHSNHSEKDAPITP